MILAPHINHIAGPKSGKKGTQSMATKGSTYAQEMPEGAKRHRELLKEQREAAKARRAAKARKKREAKENA